MKLNLRFMISIVLLASFAQLSLAKDHAQPAVDLQQLVNDVHAQFAGVTEGKNPDYIPALAIPDPKLFAISIVTADGKTYSAGDIDHIFSIQSVSKAFNIAAVMQQQGDAVVVEKIGVNATGLPFNSIMAIELNEEGSVNPLVNAGAMAQVSLLKAKSAKKKWQMIEGNLEAFAGRDLKVIPDIYKSESETNINNQAIARLLANDGRFYADVEESVDLYTKMCSVGINAKDLAIMGATYANRGVNPITGKKVVDSQYVPKILALMATAGLYDDAGLWLWKVGLPAKSGVGGGIVAVVPGKYGIAAFSPPVDEAGNSVRSQLAIEAISKALKANVFE
jgi:glutaminase